MATTSTTAAKPGPRTTKRRKPSTAKPAAKPASRARSRHAGALDTHTALSIGAAVLAIGAGIAGFLARRQIAAWAAPDAVAADGHAAPDLEVDRPHSGADTRAPVDFRPDMDAPISPADREALRPATGPAPDRD